MNADEVKIISDYLCPKSVKQPIIKHDSNCITNLKTWADESRCDCGLKELRLLIDPYVSDSSLAWKQLIEMGKAES